jgi:hypothetical protein
MMQVFLVMINVFTIGVNVASVVSDIALVMGNIFTVVTDVFLHRCGPGGVPGCLIVAQRLTIAGDIPPVAADVASVVVYVAPILPNILAVVVEVALIVADIAVVVCGIGRIRRWSRNLCHSQSAHSQRSRRDPEHHLPGTFHIVLSPSESGLSGVASMNTTSSSQVAPRYRGTELPKFVPTW